MSVMDRETHRGFAEQVVRRRDCQVFRRLLPGQMPLPGTATGPAWAGGSSGALRPFAEILSFCDKKVLPSKEKSPNFGRKPNELKDSCLFSVHNTLHLPLLLLSSYFA